MTLPEFCYLSQYSDIVLNVILDANFSLVTNVHVSIKSTETYNLHTCILPV